MKSARLLPVLLILLPSIAFSWWSNDWKQRTAIALNTSSAFPGWLHPPTNVAIPVRLHSGNFDFLNVKADGS
jgi:biopolymer transport protein ExbB